MWVPDGLSLGTLLRKILLFELWSCRKIPTIRFWLHPNSFKIISEEKGRSQTALLTLLILTPSSSMSKIPTGACWVFLSQCRICIYMKKCLQLFETHIWSAHTTAVHRSICCWWEEHSSVCKVKCLSKWISPLHLLVSPPDLSFPGAEWPSLRTETICVLLMLRGIKLCRWELISVLLLSCLAAGVGFMVVPSKLAEAVRPCKIMLICDWCGSPLLLACRSICLFCVWIWVCQRNTIYPADRDNKTVTFCYALVTKSKGPLPSLCCQQTFSA